MTKYFFKILIICGLFLLIACKFKPLSKEQKKTFEFAKEKKEIQIINFEEISTFEVEGGAFFSHFNYTETDTSLIITRIKPGENKIHIFDVYKKKHKVVNLQNNLADPTSVGYINADSFFIFYSPIQLKGWHDSIIFQTNLSGKMLRSYSLKGAQVFSSENPQFLNNDTSVILDMGNNQGFNRIGNNLFLHFVPRGETLGEAAYQNSEIAGYINLSENKYYPVKLQYPNIDFGRQFYNRFYKHFFSIKAHDNDVLFAFRYSPQLIKYDIKSQEMEEVSIKSSVYDTIYPAASTDKVRQNYEFDAVQPVYFTIQYDKYRKLYYRFVALPRAYRGQFPEYSVIVADTMFKTVAEGFPPLKYNAKFIITKNYLITYSNRTKTIPNKTILTCYKIKFRKGTNYELIRNIKARKTMRKAINKPITHYVKKCGGVREKNYTAIFIWHEGMCNGVTGFMYEAFQHYKNDFQKNNVFLFIETNKPNEVKTMLKTKYKLNIKKYTNIKIDTIFAYSAYNNFQTESFPRLIKVRNGKITNDTILEVENGHSIVDFLTQSLKEQKNMKKK